MRTRRAAAEPGGKDHVQWLRTDYELPDYYDLRTGHLNEDVDFYIRLFAETTPALLELGCGTGRILEVLARRGFGRLTGVDVAPQMLERAREKLARHGVELHRLDAGRRWEAGWIGRLGGQDAVLIPFNAFHEIGPLQRRRRCLENCFRILVPGGRVVIDTRIPPFFVRGTRTVEPRLVRSFTDAEGHFVESYIELRADFVQQTLTGSSTYRVYACEGGALEREYRAPVRSWLTKPEELGLLAEVCGFRVEHRWGGYDRSAYRPQSERHIAVLRKT